MPSNENTARVRNMFGNFDIHETIGQGGMGIVYRARDLTLNRDVALKVLKDELRENGRVVARFRREAEAIASLDHPHIVQVFSVGAVGNIPYFAMEFIEGKPLNRILRRHKFLQWKPALRIARDVAEALEAAHHSGIIHRDIKPGNILVDRTGNAFVTDFGIAKVLTAETQLTVDGSKLGTPQYMSPERVQNQEITNESDIYSLGVVLFQMLTGRLPYDAHDPIELIRMVVVDPPRRIREYKPQLSEDIERLVAYMIEKKPQNRPSSAGQVVELINRLLDGKPLFDSDSGIDDALDELREEVSTPYSDSTLDSAIKKRAAWQPLVQRFAAPWSRTPGWAKWLVAAVPVIIVAFGLGNAYHAIGRTDSAIEVVRSFASSTEAWYEDPTIAFFRASGNGLTAISSALHGYEPVDINWTSDATAAVQVSNGPQASLIAIDTTARSATLVVPVETWPPDLRLLAYASDSRVAAVAKAAGKGEWDLSLARLGTQNRSIDLVPFAPSATSVAMHPERSRMLVARREGRGGYVVEEWTLDPALPQADVLFTSQAELRSVSYALTGDAFVFQELTPDGPDTIIDAPEGRRRLTLGPVQLPSAALNAGADKLVALASTDGRTTAAVFDAVTGVRLLELGDAFDAGWTGVTQLAVVANDAAGDAQVFRWDVLEASQPIQITTVEGGIQPKLFISPEGKILVITATDRPELLMIEP